MCYIHMYICMSAVANGAHIICKIINNDNESEDFILYIINNFKRQMP